MVIRRSFSRWSASLILIAVLSACGGAPASPAAPAEAPTAEQAPEATQESTAVEVPTDAPVATEAPKGDEPVAGAVEGSVGTSGVYVSDLGFRPEVNGFGFPNYGGQGETNLTPVEVRRMFGDRVCSSIEGDTCILTPPAAQWLEQISNSMNGGHCEGMAVLSNLFYTGKINPADFGADTVPALELAGNEPLQREIAYWFTTQYTEPARAGIVPQTPSGVVNTLLTSFAAGAAGGEQFAVGFYKRDRTGGHAVTPYAVEDRGDGVYWIMVYDNNYPGAARAIEVNTQTDTWTYSGSTNPAEAEGNYEGDAGTQTLELAPIAPRIDTQECPFCDVPATGHAGGSMLAPALQYNEIWLEGQADLLISDLEGHSMGFKDGVFINEIPGAKTNGNKFGVNVWDINAEPVYYIPTTIDFTISIDGSRITEPTTSTVTMIGPGYALEVSDIILEPGQIDTLDVSPDGSLLSYRTETGETPFITVAIETEASDYLFGVYGEAMAPGEALNLSLDTKEGWISIDTIDNTESGSYGLIVAQYNDQGEQIFGAEGVELAPDDVVYVDYLKWPGNGEPMQLDVDSGGDGSVDATLEVEDVTDIMQE